MEQDDPVPNSGNLGTQCYLRISQLYIALPNLAIISIDP